MIMRAEVLGQELRQVEKQEPRGLKILRRTNLRALLPGVDLPKVEPVIRVRMAERAGN
jgi:hypothetical protein